MHKYMYTLYRPCNLSSCYCLIFSKKKYISISMMNLESLFSAVKHPPTVILYTIKTVKQLLLPLLLQ